MGKRNFYLPTSLSYLPTYLTTYYYLLYCPTCTNERMTLLNKIKSINCGILEFSDAAVAKILLFGENTFSDSDVLSEIIIYKTKLIYFHHLWN